MCNLKQLLNHLEKTQQMSAFSRNSHIGYEYMWS